MSGGWKKKIGNGNPVFETHGEHFYYVDEGKRNARRVDGFGVPVDEFDDGSVLVERETLAFPNRNALIEWVTEGTAGS
jgi:hypothetical protein